VARRIAPALADAWIEIVTSGKQLARGSKEPEIEWLLLFGTICDEPRCLVGTASEIAAKRGAQVVVTQVGGSASRTAAVLLHRADKHEIAVPEDFWTVKPVFLAGDFAVQR
jgi:hypothetical protein